MSKNNDALFHKAVATIAWAAAWHFSSWLLDATIKKAQWRELAAITTGVVMMYLPVRSFLLWAERRIGADEQEANRADIAFGFAYFAAYVLGGIGTVIGRAIDPRLHHNGY